MKAVFAGFFDPITVGHLDIIKRGSLLVDELVILVADSSKKNEAATLFQRQEMVQRCIEDLPNVSVKSFSGMLTDEMQRQGIRLMLRGIRNNVDFDYEYTLSQMYKSQMREVESIYLLTDPTLHHVSSTNAREVAFYGGNLEGYIDDRIIEKVQLIYSAKK